MLSSVALASHMRPWVGSPAVPKKERNGGREGRKEEIKVEGRRTGNFHNQGQHWPTVS